MELPYRNITYLNSIPQMDQTNANSRPGVSKTRCLVVQQDTHFN